MSQKIHTLESFNVFMNTVFVYRNAAATARNINDCIYNSSNGDIKDNFHLYIKRLTLSVSNKLLFHFWWSDAYKRTQNGWTFVFIFKDLMIFHVNEPFETPLTDKMIGHILTHNLFEYRWQHSTADWSAIYAFANWLINVSSMMFGL